MKKFKVNKNGLIFFIMMLSFCTVIFTIAVSRILARENENNIINNEIKFIDDLGRVVFISSEIKAVLGTGPSSQTVLYTLVPERMVGWNAAPTKEELKYLPKEATEIPQVGSLFNRGDKISPEEIVALSPELIIDLGDKKPNLQEELDRLQEDTGIPVVFFESGIDDLSNIYKRLGEIFDIDTSRQVHYLEEKLEYVQMNRKFVQVEPQEYYLGSGRDGLMTAPSDSFQTATLDYVGLKNIYQVDDNKRLNLQEVSPEQVIKWDPEVLIFHPNTGYDSRDKLPWSMTTAYANGQIYEVPGAPFNWISGSINRVIGTLWLGNLLYPDIYEIDMIKEAQDFYQLFYHYELSEEQAKNLMNHSIFLEK